MPEQDNNQIPAADPKIISDALLKKHDEEMQRRADASQQEWEEDKKQKDEDELNRERQKKYGPGPSGKGPEGMAEVHKPAALGPTDPNFPLGLSISEEEQRDAILREQGATADETTRAIYRDNLERTLTNLDENGEPRQVGMAEELGAGYGGAQTGRFPSKGPPEDGGPMKGLEPSKSHDGPPPMELAGAPAQPITQYSPVGTVVGKNLVDFIGGPDDGQRQHVPQQTTVGSMVNAWKEENGTMIPYPYRVCQCEADKSFFAEYAGEERGVGEAGPGRTEPMSVEGPANVIDSEVVTQKAAQCGNNDPEVAAELAGVLVPEAMNSFSGRRAAFREALVDHADAHALDLLTNASFAADGFGPAIPNDHVFRSAFFSHLAAACAFEIAPAQFRESMQNLIAIVWTRIDLDYDVSHAKFFRSILTEFAYQMEKWGTEFDAKNTANDWVAYIVRYYNRVINEAGDEGEALTAFVKVATLAYAGAIATVRLGGPAPRHYDAPPADPNPLTEKKDKDGKQEFGEGGFPIAR